MKIKIHDLFDTEAENNCLCVEAPDADGNFLGFDSDRVLVQFNEQMITRIEPT